jgi:RNA polymerase sigma-70 factor (ECF subfamily)
MRSFVGEGNRVTSVDDEVADAPADFVACYTVGYSRLAAQLFAYLGDATEAEDVVQEAYLRAWRSWGSISRYDDPVGWVRRVAWNLATSRLRRLTTVARFLARQPVTPAIAQALGPDRVALVAALRQLPQRQRLAIVLHYVADLPVADIAAELAVSRGTVLSWLHRGRARLADLLGADDSVEDGEA